MILYNILPGVLHKIYVVSYNGCYIQEQVAFLGCIGNHDTYGQTLQECAMNDGVVTHYQYNTIHPTGTCAALINTDGERALIANLGAANHFTITHLTDNTTSQNIIQSTQIYYCAGFFLTVSLESLLYVANQTVLHPEKIFAINLSAHHLLSTSLPIHYNRLSNMPIMYLVMKVKLKHMRKNLIYNIILIIKMVIVMTVKK